MTTSSIPISEELLKHAFKLAEERLRGQSNYEITKNITNEVGPVKYEGSLNSIICSSLSDTLKGCSVLQEYELIDICVIHDNAVVAAIESKGMVANSFRKDKNRVSIDLHGIRTKLYPDRRNLNKTTGIHNCVQTDISNISEKIPNDMKSPRFEIFVPVIYELYRRGGTEADLFSANKPWITLQGFRELRKEMRRDFIEWFRREDSQIRLIHAGEAIELRGANELWIQQSQAKYPRFISLEAYLNFYAFGRFVE